MANADGRLFNIDRWTIYSLQRLFPNKDFGSHHYSYGWGELLTPTPKQLRRMRKKMHKRNDFSVGVLPYIGPSSKVYPKQ